MLRAAFALVLVAAPAVAGASHAELQKQHAAAELEYRKAAVALRDTPAGHKQGEALWQAFDRGQATRFDAAVKLAMADPRSPTARDALIWVLSVPRAYYLPAGVPALDLAAAFHAADPKLAEITFQLGRLMPTDSLHPVEHAAGVRLLEAVAAKNPDRVTRGQAAAGLADQAHRRFAYAEYKRSPDTDRLAKAAEAAYEALARDYSDCPVARAKSDRTLGDVAFAHLFELRNLRVGKVAPDIAGDDLDGKRFRLSDTRGKVTLLVFWAGWCDPCMAMVPLEKKLVERHRGKPFVIVGVNGDDDRAKARELATQKGMTWRSFWNGEQGPYGPISTTWNVRGWPEIYLLDAAGVIRYRGVVRDELDKAVDELLAELDKK